MSSALFLYRRFKSSALWSLCFLWPKDGLRSTDVFFIGEVGLTRFGERIYLSSTSLTLIFGASGEIDSVSSPTTSEVFDSCLNSSVFVSGEEKSSGEGGLKMITCMGGCGNNLVYSLMLSSTDQSLLSWKGLGGFTESLLLLELISNGLSTDLEVFSFVGLGSFSIDFAGCYASSRLILGSSFILIFYKSFALLADPKLDQTECC